MRSTIQILHKYLSLCVVALWLLQAVTGVLLVFHWELDDWSVRGGAGPLEPAAFSRALDAMARSGPARQLSGVYPSAGRAGRFDVLLDRSDGRTDILRVDGQGRVLRQRPGNYDWPHIGVFQIATYLHQTLFAHNLGRWFIGLSGLLLLTNLGMGLTLAWPRRGGWRKALLPTRAARAPMTVHGWHRALGLWFAWPALVIIAAGAIMAFETPLSDWFTDTRAPPAAKAAAAEPMAARSITAATAIVAAERAYPNAPLSVLEPPAANAPWWKVSVRQRGEWRRFDGTTTLYVSSRSGRLLANYDALRAPLKTRFWDSLYAIHTGEAAGVVGRWISVLIGVCLASLCALGLCLWWLRRPRPQPQSHS